MTILDHVLYKDGGSIRVETDKGSFFIDNKIKNEYNGRVYYDDEPNLSEFDKQLLPRPSRALVLELGNALLETKTLKDYGVSVLLNIDKYYDFTVRSFSDLSVKDEVFYYDGLNIIKLNIDSIRDDATQRFFSFDNTLTELVCPHGEESYLYVNQIYPQWFTDLETATFVSNNSINWVFIDS